MHAYILYITLTQSYIVLHYITRYTHVHLASSFLLLFVASWLLSAHCVRYNFLFSIYSLPIFHLSSIFSMLPPSFSFVHSFCPNYSSFSLSISRTFCDRSSQLVPFLSPLPPTFLLFFLFLVTHLSLDISSSVLSLPFTSCNPLSN